jgi:glycosyltransferase involved in cell wall biosynthesis
MSTSISIITISNDNSSSFRKTCESLEEFASKIKSEKEEIEVSHICVLPDSVDLDLKRKTLDLVRIQVSDRGRGIYSAMNAGIKKALESNPEWIMFLSAGTNIHSKLNLKELARALSLQADILLCSYDEIVNRRGRNTRIHKKPVIKTLSSGQLKEMPTAHQSILFGKRSHEGLRYMEYKGGLAADFLHLLQAKEAELTFRSCEYVILIEYKYDGISRKKSSRSRIEKYLFLWLYTREKKIIWWLAIDLVKTEIAKISGWR